MKQYKIKIMRKVQVHLLKIIVVAIITILPQNQAEVFQFENLVTQIQGVLIVNLVLVVLKLQQ